MVINIHDKTIFLDFTFKLRKTHQVDIKCLLSA